MHQGHLRQHYSKRILQGQEMLLQTPISYLWGIQHRLFHECLNQEVPE